MTEVYIYSIAWPDYAERMEMIRKDFIMYMRYCDALSLEPMK